MSDIFKDSLSTRIKWTHQSIISSTEVLTEEEFTRQPGPTSPPIGWHVWHVSRWADRLQASFRNSSQSAESQTVFPDEIWIVEDMATHWDLNPDNLGLLETGAGMDVKVAVEVALCEHSKLFNYAGRVFEAAEKWIDDYRFEQLQQIRPSVLPQIQKSPEDKPIITGERQGSVFDDLLFHATHASRHLGMIEALRGTLFSIPGTTSI
jgi:hypothetical protein